MSYRGRRAVLRVAIITTVALCLGVLPSCWAASTAGAGDREAAASAFVSKLAKGDFAGADDAFDAAAKRKLPADALARTWQMIETQAGRYEKQEGTRTERASGIDVVYVTCKFERRLMDVKMVFNGKGEVSVFGFVSSQAGISQSSESIPQRPLPEGVRETSVSIGAAATSLPGVLTKPKGAGPFPAVVLVHGSGPNDRDETIGPNKPFRDLAAGLAANGIAVLRYDKRTLARRDEMIAIAGTITVKEETINDALAAVELLRTDKEIDPNRIFILGHSLGGYLAPRIGRLDSRIAGLIIFAGNTRPLEDLIADQTRYILALDGDMSPSEKAELAKVDAQVARVKDPKFAAARYSPAQLPLGLPQPYWADLKGYDPVQTAAGLMRPILVLWGERDYQVTRADYEGWRKGFEARRDVAFKSYPALNHLFIGGEGKSTPAEYERVGHVSEEVVKDIGTWIKRQPGRQRGSNPEGKP